MKADQQSPVKFRKILNFFIIAVAISVVAGSVFGPNEAPVSARRSATMMSAKAISICMGAYSADHGGRYPEGATSTEVFQHLIDEGYVTDPSIFYLEYLHIPGKVHPTGTHLKSENVCWDVTSPIDGSSPGKLPIIFVAGFRISYQPGAEATAVSVLPVPERTWSQWCREVPIFKRFIAYACKDTSAATLSVNDDGSIPNFIPADFDPKGKTYRQLTP